MFIPGLFFSRSCITLGLLLFATTGLAESAAARQQLDRFLDDLKTYQAEFIQLVLEQEQVGEQRSVGTFYLERPGKFLWRYHSPNSIYVLADGKNIWLVDEELEQVTQRSQRRALEGTPAMLLASSIDLEQEFKFNELGTHLGLSWLELIPRNEESQFEQIMLAFLDADLVKLEMSDKFGQTTRFDFSKGERNKNLDPGLFIFRPPPGYDILQQDE